ncbi:hypothetical protein MKW92_040272 [Papaver armeniacum]|nr:hypothetical protein MKW92_040272 [Papaver armeniacum]
MTEKLKQNEKETKKLQDSLRSLQLRFAVREQLCRNLQEKLRDSENQLAEERKITPTGSSQLTIGISICKSSTPQSSSREEATTRSFKVETTIERNHQLHSPSVTSSTLQSCCYWSSNLSHQ